MKHIRVTALLVLAFAFAVCAAQCVFALEKGENLAGKNILRSRHSKTALTIPGKPAEGMKEKQLSQEKAVELKNFVLKKSDNINLRSKLSEALNTEKPLLKERPEIVIITGDRKIIIDIAQQDTVNLTRLLIPYGEADSVVVKAGKDQEIVINGTINVTGSFSIDRIGTPYSSLPEGGNESNLSTGITGSTMTRTVEVRRIPVVPETTAKETALTEEEIGRYVADRMKDRRSTMMELLGRKTEEEN